MSFVSSIRDYVEFLNNLSNSLGNELTSSKFISETCFYLLKTLQYSFYYIVSLQWLRDFTLLPVTIPQISHAIFSENLFLDIPNASKVFFQFLEIPSIDQNKFFLGFFNSFFLTLPITLTHIITFRRLLIQGIPAAVFSFFGFILGQTLFILCVTFGLRTILIPWLSLEPFNYILGLILIFQVIYNMVGENLTPLKWNDESHRKYFLNFFLVNFILSWCEQSCIFQYFSNITLSAYPSIVEGFSTKTTLASFFSHSNYILGIFIGSILFSILWSFVILQIKTLLVNFTGISLASFIQTVNKGTFVIVLAFSLSSIPFYSFDYIFTAPLGFVSGDNFFKNTIFSQNKIKEPYSSLFVDQNLNFDVAPFDRGRYLLSSDMYYTFEDLNYRGELDWLMRSEKKATISDSKGSFLSISKIFKKQKDNQAANNLLNSEQINKYEKYNSLLPENISETKRFSFDSFDNSESENRFYNWYNFKDIESAGSDESEKADKQVIKLFKEFNFYNYPAYPVNFSSELENRPESQIEKKIKQKYYSNPIYKNLLALDIDLFLNRQLDSNFLAKEDEIDLYQKRQILNSYYNSLRDYNQLDDTFQEFFDGTKSFSSKIYNQQFKGTLDIVRRLFSLEIKSGKENTREEFNYDLKSLEENTLNSPLKYDQPLYDNRIPFIPYHEEIPEIQFFEKNKVETSKLVDVRQDDFLSNTNREKELKNSVLKQMVSKPLYAGWDENLRKFYITNKLRPQFTSGYDITIPEKWSNKINSVSQKQISSKNNLTNSQKFEFTQWPKSEEDFKKNEVPFIGLFYTKVDKIIDTIVGEDALFLKQKYKTLPANGKTVEQSLSQNTELKESKTKSSSEELMPKRGGFVWPGTLYFDFKQFFK